jgi:hypothetical protein
LDTNNKTEGTLVAHWTQTFQKYGIEKRKIVGFSSDQAVDYVPRNMGITHIPCATHLLDLALEDGNRLLKEELEKLTAVRTLLTTKNAETLYFIEQSKLDLPNQSFPINSMVRFVTYLDAFFHSVKYELSINSTLELLERGRPPFKGIRNDHNCSGF